MSIKLISLFFGIYCVIIGLIIQFGDGVSEFWLISTYVVLGLDAIFLILYYIDSIIGGIIYTIVFLIGFLVSLFAFSFGILPAACIGAGLFGVAGLIDNFLDF